MTLGRWVLRGIGALLFLPVAYAIAGFAGALIRTDGDWPAAGIAVGLVRGPIHYDFLLPLDPATRQAFAFAEQQRGVPVHHPDARWVLAGWGSQAFYTTAGSYSDITAGVVWQAASGDSAVMRLDVWGELTAGEVPGLTWIHLTPAQYERLRAGILDSFVTGADGAPVPSAAQGFTPTDGFWQARGRFDLFHTCNLWVGARLRAAGLRFGLWTPTPQSVELSLWVNGA